MKRFFIICAIALLSLVSCQKEITGNISDGQEITMSLVTSGTTKTELSGDDVIWSDGDMLSIIQTVSGGESAGNTVITSATGVTDDGGSTMKFTFSAKEIKDASNFVYNAVYPSGTVQAATNLESVTINTKSLQSPTSTSYDKSADLLIAKQSGTYTSQPTTITNVRFKRMVSLAQMIIKNLGSTEPVTTITFSAKNGDNDITLAGRTAYNLTQGTVSSSYGSNLAEESIVLDYTGKSITANSSMTAYFTCYPFELTENDSFTVIVETATKSFTRTVTLSSGQTLSLTAGNGAKFSVNMNGVEGVAKAIDLNYACLTAEEYADESTSSSYASVVVEKSTGDNWNSYSCYTSNSIGVRTCDGNKNDSYIKLPVFTRAISSVTITVEPLNAGKSLLLTSSPTVTTGDISSNTTVANQTVYVFDLSDKTIYTAYFRSYGAQAKVKKIEVICTNDTRESIAKTASISAVLNTNVTNSIDVTWTEVTDAIGYRVICTPTTVGKSTVENEISGGDSNKLTVEGLEYSTEYTISVVTLANKYNSLDSDPLEYGTNVTTGAKPSGAATYTIEFKTNTSDGSTEIKNTTSVSDVVEEGSKNYISSFTSTCSKAYYKSKNGVKLGSNSSPGTIEFTLSDSYQANIKSITVVSAKYGSDTGTLTLSDQNVSLTTGITPGTDYTYTYDTATDVTSIKIQTSSKRAYISKIILTTEE